MNFSKKKNIFFKFEIFFKNHHPTHYIKYKVIDFALNDIAIMANSLLQAFQFLRGNELSLTSS